MPLTLVSAILALLGVAMAARGIYRLLRNPAWGSANLGMGCILLACGLLGLGIALNLASYARLTHEQPIISFSTIDSGVKVYVQQAGVEEVSILEIPAHVVLRVEADIRLNNPSAVEWRQNRMTIRGDVIVSAISMDRLRTGRVLESQFVRAPIRMELRDAIVLLEKQ